MCQRYVARSTLRAVLNILGRVGCMLTLSRCVRLFRFFYTAPTLTQGRTKTLGKTFCKSKRLWPNFYVLEPTAVVPVRNFLVGRSTQKNCYLLYTTNFATELEGGPINERPKSVANPLQSLRQME